MKEIHLFTVHTSENASTMKIYIGAVVASHPSLEPCYKTHINVIA